MTDDTPILDRLAQLTAAEADRAQQIRWQTARAIAAKAPDPHDLDAVRSALAVLGLTERHLQEDVDLLTQHAERRSLADPVPVEALRKEVREIAAAAEARHHAAVEELAAADRDLAAARDAGLRVRAAHEALMAARRDAVQLERQLVERGCPQDVYLTAEQRQREHDAAQQDLREREQWLQDALATAAPEAQEAATPTLAPEDHETDALAQLEPPAPAAPPPRSAELMTELMKAAAAMGDPALGEESLGHDSYDVLSQ